MNPTSDKIYSSADDSSSFGTGAGSPPEGSEGVLPLPGDDAPDSDEGEDRPDRAGQIGEGSYEGTDGYAKSIGAYLKKADVEQDAQDAAPGSLSEAEELLYAEAEAASHSKAPGK